MTFEQTYAVLLFIALVILVILANRSKAKDRARRAAIARHPAGKALDRSESRHLDTPGYDWVNGKL